MRDIIPPPSPKIKVKKGKLPAAIADYNARVLISSIASYQEMTKGKICCYLKSGETVTLDFDVAYLSEKAMKVLDAHFNIEQPIHDACEICVRRDVIYPAESPRKYCDYCFGDREYFTAQEDKDE